jgi:hypothetical protein
MALQEKVLWVVNYSTLQDFVDRSIGVDANAVAIRTDNDLLTAIPTFHRNAIKVYGWRWPSAQRDAAMSEADRVANLLSKGLDGYFVDPEGAPGKPYDWDQQGLDQLAEDFCNRITSAAPEKPFGVTSHYRAEKVFPDLPWRTFFRHSSILLPQAYWRSDEGKIGHGPSDNYRVALDCWLQAGGDRTKIVPMAGELAHVTGAEIDAHVQEANAQSINRLHFYTYQDDVPDDVWQAVTTA